MTMRILTFLLLIPIAQAVPQPAGDRKGDLLQWNEFYELQWHDFRGQPGESNMGDAGTAVHIKAKPYLVKRKIRYNVTAFFNRQKSWKRDQSPALLAHERLHFDIAELYARKIRKKIAELHDRGVDDVKVYNNAIQQLLSESNDADARYDMETLHGALPKKQTAWEKQVRAEMKILSHFKKVKRVIGG